MEERLSDALKFERAAALRDRIKAIESLSEKQTAIATRLKVQSAATSASRVSMRPGLRRASAMPRAIGRLGAGACTIASQQPQASFGRT